MVLYLCIVANRGARLGHKLYEYFGSLFYCKIMGFNFVYTDFICRSVEFNKYFEFYKLHEFRLDEIRKNMRIIYMNNKNISESELETNLCMLHDANENICMYVDICDIPTMRNIIDKKKNKLSKDEIDKIYSLYHNFVMRNTVSPKTEKYIAIHARCGDIIEDKTRFLPCLYFIKCCDRLFAENTDLEKMPVYIIAEENFDCTEILEKYPSFNVIKTDAVTSLNFLIHSEYLIASRSGFSYVANIFGKQKIISPPNDWNKYDNPLFIGNVEWLKK